jgi:hypothetical protein
MLQLKSIWRNEKVIVRHQLNGSLFWNQNQGSGARSQLISVSPKKFEKTGISKTADPK